MMTFIPGTDVYGPGSWIDPEPLSVSEDTRRVLRLLAKSTPGFSNDPSVLDSVSYEGSATAITPGPLKSQVIAAALHGMCGIVANELLQLRDGTQSRQVSVNTDHAAFWLGSVGMSRRNGISVRELAQQGQLGSIFPKDLENDTFATPLRLRATANYPTKDSGVWYQLHGSLNADPVLEAIGLDPKTPCNSNEEAFEMISREVKRFGAHELESINIAKGLCGSICYTPEQWRSTRMSKDLSQHPLINYKRQTHAAHTPAIPMSVTSDRRPLAGIKVVEIVRIIAGPVIGSTLAAMGADVVRVNCSRLPDFNLSLNAGVRTIDVDFDKPNELNDLMNLVQDADIFIQGYRPGVINKRGLGLHDLLEVAAKRGKGIIYVEENCYGPSGPMSERPGWQQVADAASGCSYVTGRSLGYTDGTCVLPVLPVPDMLTGLIGAIGAMMAVRDRAQHGGSYHVFASLMAAATLPLEKDIGLYDQNVVSQCAEKFAWDQSGPEQFVLELLDIALKGWKKVFPEYFENTSVALKGDWGEFQLLKPVMQLSDAGTSPSWNTAPEPNCYHSSGTVGWK